MVLYEMLTGELPYDAETPGAVVMMHVGGLSRSPKGANPRVPEALDAVTARLLSKDPADRYADAAALMEDLGRVKAGLAPVAETMKARTRVGRARRLRRRDVLVALALLLVSVGVVGVVALNGSSQSAGNAHVQTLPSAEGSSLKPGEYRTDEFRPTFTFAVDKGWITFLGAELSDALVVLPASARGLPKPPNLGFYAPQAVANPSDPTGNTVVPAPDSVDGWVEWFQKHPNLRTEKPLPVTVGGASGVRIDAVVASVPDGHPAWFWVLNDGTTIQDNTKGGRFRTFILNVDGETVLIAIRAPGDKPEGFLAKAQKVVNTVEWKSE